MKKKCSGRWCRKSMLESVFPVCSIVFISKMSVSWKRTVWCASNPLPRPPVATCLIIHVRSVQCDYKKKATITLNLLSYHNIVCSTSKVFWTTWSSVTKYQFLFDRRKIHKITTNVLIFIYVLFLVVWDILTNILGKDLIVNHSTKNYITLEIKMFKMSSLIFLNVFLKTMLIYLLYFWMLRAIIIDNKALS